MTADRFFEIVWKTNGTISVPQDTWNAIKQAVITESGPNVSYEAVDNAVTYFGIPVQILWEEVPIPTP